MEKTKTKALRSFPNWIFGYSIGVTALHGAVHASWFALLKLTPDLDHSERVDVYNEFWVIPDLIGIRFFGAILLLLSLSVIVIAGRLADHGKGPGAIVVLLLNICLFFLTGWGLL